MKLLILMMSCNKDHFVKQSQISKESLRRQIEHHKLENDIMVYDYVGDAESNHIDDSTIYLKTNDDMNHTFDKTYDCIQFINSQNIEYDYIFRTNTSTFINVKLLYEFVKFMRPNDVLWTAEIYSTYDIKCPEIYDPYPRGNGLILSKYVLDIIFKNVKYAHEIKRTNEIFKNGCTLSDDVALGCIFNKCFNIEVVNHIKSFTHGWYKTYDRFIHNKGNKFCTWDNECSDPDFIKCFITIQLKDYLNTNDLCEEKFNELTNNILSVKYENVLLQFVIEYSLNPSIYTGYLSKLLYADYNTWIHFYYNNKAKQQPI